MKTIFLSIVLLAFAFAGIAIKLLFKKNGKFAGTCSSRAVYQEQKGGECCGICGAKPDGECRKD